MKKVGLVLACLVSLNAFADEFFHPGYLNSAYGYITHDAYGDCVHTAYFDKDLYGVDECGEGPPPPPPKPQPVTVTETVVISDADNVLFNFDKASLTSSGTSALTDFITKIGGESDVTQVSIEGYTDAIGEYNYNMKLSKDRANTVRQFFVLHGYPENKISADGFGPKDAKVSAGCVSQYGVDPAEKIWSLDKQLNSKRFKAKHLSKKLKHDKAALQAQLNKMQQTRTQLITCTAADRRVVFTISHTKEVVKQVDNPKGAGTVTEGVIN